MSGLPATANLIGYRGDTWTQPFVFKDGTVPVDLTGATVASWAALNGDTPIVIPATIGPDPGTVTLGPTVFATAGAYNYDIEITDPGGTITTRVRGRLVIEQDVTNRP